MIVEEARWDKGSGELNFDRTITGLSVTDTRHPIHQACRGFALSRSARSSLTMLRRASRNRSIVSCTRRAAMWMSATKGANEIGPAHGVLPAALSFVKLHVGAGSDLSW